MGDLKLECHIRDTTTQITAEIDILKLQMKVFGSASFKDNYHETSAICHKHSNRSKHRNFLCFVQLELM